MEPAAPAAPARPEALAVALAAAATEGRGVRFTGAGTKLSWGRAPGEPTAELSTARLDRLVEHNAGDLTAVLEAGMPLARAQATFAEAGQMLALDPPDDGATVGGVVATADSGPLRARYGGVRDLVLGVRAALADGTIVKSGGKVIKNVAGYDLAKLFAGSFGTLGAIVELSVRLHPLPPATATALGRSSDPDALGRAASELAHAALEQQSLDVRFGAGEGMVLSRFGGAAPHPQAEAAERLLRAAGLATELVDDDEPLWAAQRAGQRSATGAVVRIAAVQTELPAVLRTARRHDAELVGRAAVGLSWLRLEDRSPAEAAAAVEALRDDFGATVLDRPPELAVDPWGPVDPGALSLTHRVKERFDPTDACNRGVFLV